MSNKGNVIVCQTRRKKEYYCANCGIQMLDLGDVVLCTTKGCKFYDQEIQKTDVKPMGRQKKEKWDDPRQTRPL
jgi:hypothetical protein